MDQPDQQDKQDQGSQQIPKSPGAFQWASEKIAWYFQNGRKIFLFIVCLLILAFVLSSMKITCGCKPPLPPANVIVEPDPDKPIITKPTSVTYTPKTSNKNPKPTPTTVSKPIEGKVTIDDGKVKIQQLGFCLIGKAGCSTEGWYVGARWLFWGKFGSELMFNDKRGFIGVDYRIPILNQITISAGGTTPYQFPIKFSPYAGASVCLNLW